MKDCLGIINLDEDESRIRDLVVRRPIAAIPIAARYRVVDFVLSNMTNSGIEYIGLFTKNKSRSLMEHLKNGGTWDLHRKRQGLKIFNFETENLFNDDVHNFMNNIEFIKYSRKKYIVMSSSYMLCNMDYKRIINEHKISGADITMVYKNINNAKKAFINCEVLNLDQYGNLISVGKNIGSHNNVIINMEIYIMSIDLFIDIIEKSIEEGIYKKIKGYITSNVDKLKIRGHEFRGYLACINSLVSYYKANMDFLKNKVNHEIFNEVMPIVTKTKDESPTQYTKDSCVRNSIIANGCFIEGEVKNSIIGRRVYVGKGSKIENCVILQNTVIERNSYLDRVIADKGSQIEEGEKLIGAEEWPVFISKKE